MVDTPSHGDSPSRDVLRRRLCAERAALTSAALQRAAENLREHARPLVDGTRRVAGYRAVRGEIDVAPLLRYCRERGAETYFPVITPVGMRFAPADGTTRWVRGVLGIEVPDVEASALVEGTALDLVLVPLVAFDARGNRLGMGGGYYDRAFADRLDSPAPPRLLGCAHALQRVEALSAEAWDVPLDAIATDTGVIRPGA